MVTIIKIVILLTVLALFGGILIDSISLIVSSIIDSVTIFGYMNTILADIGDYFPTILKQLVMLSLALLLVGIVLKVRSTSTDMQAKRIVKSQKKNEKVQSKVKKIKGGK